MLALCVKWHDNYKENANVLPPWTAMQNIVQIVLLGWTEGTQDLVQKPVGLSHVPADMGTIPPKVIKVHVLHSGVKLKEMQLISLSAAKAQARHQQKYTSTSNFTNKTK